MKSLIVDTSTEKSLLVIEMDDGTLKEKSLPSGYQSSNELIRALQIDFSGIEWVGVTLGPGLMTGTRVGIAAVSALSLGLGVPCVGISTFAGYLSRSGQACLIDAGARGAYLQKWGGEPRFCQSEAIKEYLSDSEEVVGPNLNRYPTLKGKERGPNAALLMAAAKEQLDSGDFSLEAIYFTGESSLKNE